MVTISINVTTTNNNNDTNDNNNATTTTTTDNNNNNKTYHDSIYDAARGGLLGEPADAAPVPPPGQPPALRQGLRENNIYIYIYIYI